MKKLLFLAVLLVAACTGNIDQECNGDGTCNSPHLVCSPFGDPPIFHHCVLK